MSVVFQHFSIKIERFLEFVKQQPNVLRCSARNVPGFFSEVVTPSKLVQKKKLKLVRTENFV